MATFDELTRLSLEPKKPDWYDKIVQAVVAIAAVYQAVQGSLVISIVLAAILALLSYPFLKRSFRALSRRRKERQAIKMFGNDLKSYVDRAVDFASPTHLNEIPEFLGNTLAGRGIQLYSFNRTISVLLAIFSRGVFRDFIRKRFLDLIRTRVLRNSWWNSPTR